MDMLPQLQAFLLEAIRWRPIAPLGKFPIITSQSVAPLNAWMPGFAHRATKDIIWVRICYARSICNGSDDDITEGSMYP